MYVLLEFWQKIMAIPIMNPLSWFMIISFVHCVQTKIFQLLLLVQKRWYSGFNRWPLSSPKTKRMKSYINFWKKQLFTNCMYFNALYWKICIALFCRSSHTLPPADTSTATVILNAPYQNYSNGFVKSHTFFKKLLLNVLVYPYFLRIRL